MKNESQFQSKIRDLLKRCDCEVLNVHGHGMQQAGWPDLYFAHGIVSGWLELKFGKGKLSKIQEIKLRRLRSKGIMALTLRWEDGKVTFDEHPDEGFHINCLGPKNIVPWIASIWSEVRLQDMTRKANGHS